jgi:beta-glucanase (GH16 family)
MLACSRQTGKRLLAALGLAAAVGAQAALPAPPAGWTLVFGDDFNGGANSGVNTSNWRYTTGTAYPGGPANFGTGEIETMTSSTANVFLDGAGVLNIRLLNNGGNWTSGRIETNREDFQPPAGGVMRVEGRIQMPNLTGAAALGYWPAFWMLGTPYRGNLWNWPSIGEIDIMENVQGINQVWGTFHCGVSPGGPCNETTGIGAKRSGFSPTLQAAFHTYAIEWDRSLPTEQIRWYVDGQQYHQVSSNQFDATTWANATQHGYFIILNNSIGGQFPATLGGGPNGGTASGGTLRVDYVAVWSRSGGGNAAAIPGHIEAEFYSAMSGVQTETTTDTGGGLDVGWIDNGDWMDYAVNVATTGNYTVSYRVAALSQQGQIYLQRNGATLATTTVPVTGGWQNWTTVSSTVSLTAGTQTLRLLAGASGFNVNWINFTKLP